MRTKTSRKQAEAPIHAIPPRPPPQKDVREQQNIQLSMKRRENSEAIVDAIFEITVPADAIPNKPCFIWINGQKYSMQCPANCLPGDMVKVKLHTFKISSGATPANSQDVPQQQQKKMRTGAQTELSVSDNMLTHFNCRNQKMRELGLRVIRETEISEMETKIEELLYEISLIREKKEAVEEQLVDLKTKNNELNAQLALIDLQEPIHAFRVKGGIITNQN
jgi:hypothetical protein